MALIQCPECKKEVSNKANSCPNCGYAKLKPKGIGLGGAVILIAAVVIGTGSLRACNSNSIERPNAEKPAKEVEKKTALQLMTIAKTQLTAENYGSATHHLNELTKQYPQSPESSEAITLLAEIPKKISEKNQRDAAIKAKEAEQKAAKLKSAIKGLKTEKDEVRNITWYSSPTTPTLTTHLHIYFGQTQKNELNLRRVTFYYGDDWLFVKNYILAIDGENFNVTPTKFERDNSGGSVWEWADDIVTNSDIDILKKVINSKKTIMRLNGQTYYKDHVITPAEKADIAKVLNSYEELKTILQ